MKNRIFILLILLIAFFLRVVTVKFNLPYIEFTDEFILADDVLHLAKKGDYKNFYFIYPPFHSYLQAGALFVYSKITVTNLDNISRSQLFPVLRTVVVFFGALSVYMVYLITKKITKNNLMAFFAMLLLAFNLPHVGYSEILKNDLPITLFGLISFYFSLLILETGKLKWYLISGIFIGFSTATGYLGISYFVPIIVSHFVFKLQHTKNLKLILFPYELLVAIFGMGIGFFLGNPIVILDPKEFLNKISNAKKSLEPYNSSVSLPAWKWYLQYYWHYGLYYPVFFATLGGLFIGFKKYTHNFIVIFSFVLFFGGLIMFQNYYTDRISLPLVPFFTIISGIFFGYLFNKITTCSCKKIKIIKFSIITAYIILFFGLFLRIAIVSYNKFLFTPLQKTEEWIIKNTNEKDRILFTSGSLPFSPNKMEEKHQLLYYYPEISNKSVDSLSLFYDYIILYWRANLPVEWVESIQNNFEKVAEFDNYKPKERLSFLNPYANIGNNYLNARSRMKMQSSIYKIPEIPRNNYIIIDKIENDKSLIKGEFNYIKGSQGEKTEIIYNIDFILESGSGAQKFLNSIKELNQSIEYKYIFDKSEKKLSIDKELDYKIKNLIKSSLEDRFNLKTSIGFMNLEFDNNDFCILGGPCRPSGEPDYHLRLSGVPKEIKRITVVMGDHSWMGPFNGAYADLFIKKSDQTIDLFYELFTKDDIGKEGKVILYYKDDTYSLISL